LSFSSLVRLARAVWAEARWLKVKGGVWLLISDFNIGNFIIKYKKIKAI
jgi:hypothetical protein